MHNTITLSRADRDFTGTLRLGEYVAYWIAHDRQSSLPLVADSYPTVELCLAEADALLNRSEFPTLRAAGTVEVVQLKDDDEAFYEHRLTPEGEALIDQFIAATARDPNAHRAVVWYSAAERAADDAYPDGSIVIEMPQAMSRTGRPETLRISRQAFTVRAVSVA